VYKGCKPLKRNAFKGLIIGALLAGRGRFLGGKVGAVCSEEVEALLRLGDVCGGARGPISLLGRAEKLTKGCLDIIKV
jgi:hypothetical protein